MDPKDRKLVIQIIGQVLISDGALTDAERGHLDGLMASFGMSDEERTAALRGISLDSPIEDRVKALSEQARARLLIEVGQAAANDGGPSPGEQAVIDRIQIVLS